MFFYLMILETSLLLTKVKRFLKNRTMLRLKVLLLGGIIFANFVGRSQDTSSFSLGDAETLFTSLHGRSSTTKLQVSTTKKIEIDLYKRGEQQVLGKLKGKASLFVLGYNRDQELEGFVIVSEHEAYSLKTSKSGEVISKVINVDKLICRGFKGHQGALDDEESALTTAQLDSLKEYAWDPYDLNSNPGATAVIYCDMDGYNLPSGTPWNSGASLNAAGTGWSDIDMLTAWYVLVEDYAPFDVNVTTNEAVYNAAPNGWKTRVVFTPTSYWSPGGGVALRGSFNWNATEVCWVFTDGFGNSVRAAEAGSHEAGHTLGLSHDGSSGDGAYYKGHGVWAPIMGVSYYLPLTQWSIGDYANATNTTDDDTWIIQDAVGGYRADDHGNTIGSASEIDYSLNGQGVAVLNKNKGIIERRTDKDVFHFYVAGGSINLDVAATGLPKPNLDFEIELLDASGNLIQKYTNNDADFTQAVNISKVLVSGDYYLSMDGVGAGSAATKWTDYSSLGQFEISGTIEGIQQKENDAAIVGINNISTKTCGNSLAPEIEILNGGSKILSSVNVSVSLNTVEVYNQNHQVSIGSGTSSVLTLNTFPISNFGDQDITVVLSLPNGVIDEIPSNNVFEQNFNMQAGQLFQFDISTGSMSTSLSWDISDNNTSVKSYNSVSSTTANNLQSQEFCLEENVCYDFEINDAFLEDLCSMFSEYNTSTIYETGEKFVFQGKVYEAKNQIWSAPPNAYPHYYNDLGACPEPTQTDYFKLENKSQNSVISTLTVAEYSSTSSENFCVSVLTSSKAVKKSEITAFPNPVFDRLNFNRAIDQIEVYDNFGKLVLQASDAYSILFPNTLSEGVYFVKAVNSNDNQWFKVLKVKR